MVCNDSTSPAMDQSGLEPSSLVQVQSKKFLDRDWTNPQFFWTWTERAWTALDLSTRAESAPIRWELLIHWVNKWTHIHILTVNSTVPSVQELLRMGRDGVMPSVLRKDGNVVVFLSQDRDGWMRRPGMEKYHPRPSSIDIHGYYSVY